MDRKTFALLESYMKACTGDSAHDESHVYRVLYQALAIAKEEKTVDYDLLIAACLLHDIGRPEQHADPKVCHAEAGAEKARLFLQSNGFSEDFACQVADCILTHRFRKNRPPESLEAKILFDADKLDVSGALGIARTLQYAAHVGAELYEILPDGRVSDGTEGEKYTVFREYRHKLEKIYDRFYTRGGRQIAQQRQEAARQLYDNLLSEVRFSCEKGPEELKNILSLA